MLRGTTQIQTTAGPVHLRFCTWSFARFAEKNGNLSFSALVDLLASGSLSAKQIVSLLLCAAEYVCLKENKGFHYTELDASDWIDEMGGLLSQPLQDVIVTAISALAAQKEATEVAEEKKEPASP